jgi:L-fucose mutarotase
MLIGLPALLGPDLLYTLRAMGHGDEIALVDGNYPAQDHARRLVRADGHGMEALLEAILAVLPVEAAARASLMNDPTQSSSYHLRIDALIGQRTGLVPQPLGGEALYPRIRAAHTIVATSETALYGNVILRKGVIGGSGPP